MQNGRRYHAYKDGSYILPNDEPEQDRLDLAHAMTTKLTGDRLHLTPLPEDFAGRVLDIGCGTGIWSICMGDRFPNAQILGNDLSPVQPSWVCAFRETRGGPIEVRERRLEGRRGRSAFGCSMRHGLWRKKGTHYTR